MARSRLPVYYTHYLDSVLLFKQDDVLLKIDAFGALVVLTENLYHYQYYFGSHRKNIQHCIGIIGVITLTNTRYVIVLRNAVPMATVGGVVIHRADQYDFISLRTETSNNVGLSNNDDDKVYVEMLKYHLRTASLLFSDTINLSRTLQSQFVSGKSDDNLSILSNMTSFSATSKLDSTMLLNQFNSDYFWNQHLLNELLNINAAGFVIPVIYGYAAFQPINEAPKADSAHSRQAWVGVISRRSKNRAGTRYFKRGIDNSGNCANFNETEQILIVKNSSFQFQISSFLQVRGSIPLHWAEINNLQYKPTLAVSKNSNFNSSVSHFKALAQKLSPLRKVYVVNLVNHKGHESPIKLSFESTMTQLANQEKQDTFLPQLEYVYFDFHEHCKKMNYQNIKLLLADLENKNYSPSDYFSLQYNIDMPNSSYTVLKTQQDLIRSNCMDCLDRTNVVQSVIAKWALSTQLGDLGFEYKTSEGDIFTASSKIEHSVTPKGNSYTNNNTVFNSKFNEIWTFNGNYISKAYSGTSALKADFTRTGKRTVNGAVKDLINSISRYFKNNFNDGYRQDSFDLFLGNFQPTLFNERIDYKQHDLGTISAHADSTHQSTKSNRYSSYTPYSGLARSHTYPSNVTLGTSPFVDTRPFKYQSMPYLLLLTTALFFSVLFFPKGNTIFTRSNLALLGCCSVIINWSIYFIITNGIQFVSWPRLCEIEYLRKVKVSAPKGKEEDVEGFEYIIADEFLLDELAKLD